jgi:anti-sigma factor ChrR (cupin superfamily)
VSVRDLLPDYVLGYLTPEQSDVVAVHIAEDPELAAEEAALREVLESVALSLRPVAPPEGLRDRILASTETTTRFERFAARVAAIFDVTVGRARELLARVDDATRWEPGPYPGVLFMHFDGGPACAGADCGFVKMTPGTLFPWHAHDEEVTLVLQGTAADSTGVALAPGVECTLGLGAAHEFRADAGDTAFIYVVKVVALKLDADRPAR